MTDPDLRSLIGLAGRADEGLDIGVLAGRVRRRRRRRIAGQAVASVLGLVVVFTGSRMLLTGIERTAPIDLAARDDVLVAVDPGVDALDGLPALSAGAREAEPTRLPDGYRRCSGPAEVGSLSTTTYCAQGRPSLSLARGPHDALPEVGREVPVAHRSGYLQRRDGRVEMTVSDDNGAGDRHHRLSVAADGDLQPADMAAILASIPAVAGAPPPTGR